MDKPTNVLLVSGWVDQAFTFVRSFSQQKNLNLFIADCWPDSPLGKSRYCQEFFLIPHYHDPGYIPNLLDICTTMRIDVVLPVHHEDLVEVSKYRQQFISRGFGLPIPEYNLLEMSMDKYQMAKLARENGLSAPETLLVSEISSENVGLEIGYPALIKLRSSTGQRGQKLVRDKVEFEKHVQTMQKNHALQDIIVQEYIHGSVLESMYTVGLLFDANHKLKLSVPLKKIRSRPFTGGTAICTRAEKRRDIQLFAEEIMGLLEGWVGISDVEIKIKPDGKPTLIEINPRPWGSMYGTLAAGVDFPVMWLKIAVGEEIEVNEDYVEGIYASFLSRDLILLKELLPAVFSPRKNEALRLIKTYHQPYLSFNRRRNGPKTSDFVLDDIRPFLTNVARFFRR